MDERVVGRIRALELVDVRAVATGRRRTLRGGSHADT
jgi:hypothetical protein